MPGRSRAQSIAVAAVTAAFSAVLVLWTLLTPALGAPDEGAHFSSIERMATAPAWPDPGEAQISGAVRAALEEGGRSRAADRSTLGELREANPGLSESVDWMTQHPPLYYAIAGAVLAVAGGDDLRWDIAAWLLRLLSVLIILPVPWLLYRGIGTLTGSVNSGVLAAATVLLVPQLQHIGASISNDSIIILGGAVSVWLVARVLTGRRDWPTLAGLGVTLAIMALTKGTGLTAVPFVVLALLLAPGIGMRRRMAQTAVVLAIAAAGLWWWAWNILRFGTLQPSGTLGLRPDIPWPPGLGPNLPHYLDALWNGVSLSFWGNFGGLRAPILASLADVLTVGALLVVAAYGFRRHDLPRSIVLASLPVVTLIMLMYTTWGVYARTQSVFGVQGRYFFVALGALVGLSAIAWLRLLPTPGQRRMLGQTVAIAAPIMTAYGLVVAYLQFYEQGAVQVLRSGLGTWAAISPLGPLGVVIAGVAAAGALVWAAAAVRGASAPVPTL